VGYFPQYIRPAEDFARTSVPTATSSQTGYLPAKAINGEPAEPWWASSGTATLTLTLAGLSRIDVVAIIHSNIDDGRAITIAGDLSGGGGVVNGKRSKDGEYPVNVAFLAPGVAPTANVITIAVAGNSLNVAIGQVAAGLLRTLSMPFVVGSGRARRRFVIEDANADFGHVIRHDLHAEQRFIRPQMIHDKESLIEMEELWEHTKGGTLPFLLFPRGTDDPEPPAWVRMLTTIEYTHQQGHSTGAWAFEEVSRGVLVA
jgi:hypothetical protein